MKLEFSLYKAPYRPDSRRNTMRYLLEAEGLDIYFWVGNHDELESFQIIHNDATVITFREGKCTVGIIANRPFNRVVMEDGYEDQWQELVRCLADTCSPDVPHTLQTIRSLLSRKPSARHPVRLSAAEAAYLASLEKTSTKESPS